MGAMIFVGKSFQALESLCGTSYRVRNQIKRPELRMMVATKLFTKDTAKKGDKVLGHILVGILARNHTKALGHLIGASNTGFTFHLRLIVSIKKSSKELEGLIFPEVDILIFEDRTHVATAIQIRTVSFDNDVTTSRVDLENVFENITAVVTVEEKEAKATRLSTKRKGSKDLENYRILEIRILEEEGAHLQTHLGRITPIVRMIGIMMVAGITDGRKAIV
jgi:hypothetical protein